LTRYFDIFGTLHFLMWLSSVGERVEKLNCKFLLFSPPIETLFSYQFPFLPYRFALMLSLSLIDFHTVWSLPFILFSGSLFSVFWCDAKTSVNSNLTPRLVVYLVTRDKFLL